MIAWREKATAIRHKEESSPDGAAVATRRKPCGDLLPWQAAFAKKVVQEVLIPVLAEFVSIVTGSPAKPIYHEYDERTVGVTCDLDSMRFTAKVYLFPDAAVRFAVFLTPSLAEGHCRDFHLSAGNHEIEEWFGGCLAKMYENR